jgi:hypothetical protein
VAGPISRADHYVVDDHRHAGACMTWENVTAFVLGWSITSAFIVALLHVCLPYLRTRSSAETRIAALEAANVALSDRVARCEQFADRASDVKLPRGMPRAV